MQREDDFELRRAHLADLSDDEVYRRFWHLTGQIVDPLIDLAKTHTSPGIEQAVILRMGFSSVESKEIVGKCMEHGLLSKGAGHAIYVLSQKRNIPIRNAGLILMGEDSKEAWNEVKSLLQ
jgi:D-ornithine 4,5-aminomutase subunit alpha